MPSAPLASQQQQRVELALSVEARDHLVEIVNGTQESFETKHCPYCKEIALALSQTTTRKEQG